MTSFFAPFGKMPTLQRKLAGAAVLTATIFFLGPLPPLSALEPIAHPCLEGTIGKEVTQSVQFAAPFTFHHGEQSRFLLGGLVPDIFPEETLNKKRQTAITTFLASSEASGRIGIRWHKKAMPDRYGRKRAWFASQMPDENSKTENKGAQQALLQDMLLHRGLGRVDPVGLTGACATHLLTQERRARDRKAGLWALPPYAIKNANSRALSGSMSSYQIVHGTVLHVARNPNGTSYLNFGRNWKQDFTVTLSKKNLRIWEEQNNSLEALLDQSIYVRGWVEDRNGPMIRIHAPEQLLRMIKDKSGDK